MYNLLSQQPAWLQQWLIISLTIFTCTPVHAQITPDNTLGSETSRIAPNTLINNASSDLINGGAIRGNNLFHSFSQFNINDGQRVYFGNPSGVQNIFTRVTGGSASNILGTLGVDGVANLFLMNPNGILFGKNASLDVRGSFVGTTANAIGFGNQGFFSSTIPETPLLTINPSALLFNQIQANAGIKNLSQAPAGVNPNGQNVTGLRVPDGKSIALVGGDINLDGSAIKAYSGRIELTSLAAPGTVGLNDTFSLSVPNILRGNISLTNGAEVNVRGTDAGSIVINAQNLTLAEGSKLRAGIDTGLGTLQSKAGDIVINATGSTVLSDGSFIANVLQSNSTGISGNININTGSLAMTNNSSFNTTTYGNGNGGNVSIKAADTVFLNSSTIFNGVETGSVGNGGNLIVDAGSISLRNGSEFNSKTSGQGNAGNISINSPDISIDGKNNQIFSRVISAVNPEGVGKVGNIQIATNSLKVTGGAFISGDVLGKGDGGNITIDARDTVDLDGDSFISTIIAGEAITRGGDIQITTGSLSLTNGASIYTSVLGKGNAGDITINARDTVKLDGVSVIYDVAGGITSDLFAGGVGKSGNIQITAGSLLVTNGSQIASDTAGRGDAGNITINTRDKVAFEGFGGSVWFSRVSTSASPAGKNSVGNAGDIQITTGELLLKDGGNIAAFNGGQGNGGNIILDVANTTTFDGFSANTGLPSTANTFTINGNGNAGNIELKTGSLFLTNGGLINTSASGTGNSGKITIDARDRINIDGVFINVGKSFNLISGLGSTLVDGEGKGGDIKITTGSLSLTNGAIISSSTSSRGNAGNITINARDTVTFDGAKDGFSSNASSAVERNGVGNGGDIRVNAKALYLTNGGAINAFSSGQGNAGNIFLNTSDIINIDGVGNNDLPSTTSAYASRNGDGGDVQIKTGTLTLTNGGNISTYTSGLGDGGDIIIDARDNIKFDGAFASSTVGSTANGNAGNIKLNTGSLSLLNGGQLNASTFGQGKAGNIIIDARDAVKIDGVSSNGSSGIFSVVGTTGKDNAGNIKLTAGSLSFANGGLLNVATFGSGDAGDITINIRDTIDIDGVGSNGNSSGIFSSVSTTGIGKGGNIAVQSRRQSVSNGAYISSSSTGRGNAGDINVNSGSVRLDGGTLAAVTNSSDGGNINLKAADFLLLRRGASISTTAGFASSGGNGGNITIDTPFIVAVPKENSDITANAFTGNGGNVNIRVQSIFGIEPRRETLLNSNDITASSRFGVQGQISIQQPEVQPTQGIIELPGEILDASNQIGQLCPRGELAFRRPLSQFIVTGRGIPPSPLQPLPGKGRIRQLASLDGEIRETRETGRQRGEGDTRNSDNSKVATTAIIEAQGFVKTPAGEILLVAQVPEATPYKATTTPRCLNSTQN